MSYQILQLELFQVSIVELNLDIILWVTNNSVVVGCVTWNFEKIHLIRIIDHSDRFKEFLRREFRLRTILNFERFRTFARDQDSWFDFKGIWMGWFDSESGVKNLFQSLFLLLYILKVCTKNIYQSDNRVRNWRHNCWINFHCGEAINIELNELEGISDLREHSLAVILANNFLMLGVLLFLLAL